MKKIRILFVLCLIAPCTALFSVEPVMDYGRFEGNVYVHDYLAMKVAVPATWQIQDSEAKKQLMQTGKDMISGQDQNMKRMLDAGELNTLNLLTVFQQPLGAAVDFNPSFVCVVEKVSHLPGIKRGSDYLFHTKRLLENGGVKYTFGPEYSETLSGVEFDVMTTELTLNQVVVKQRYYASIRKGYALAFVVSYNGEAPPEALNGMVKSIEFQN